MSPAKHAFPQVNPHNRAPKQSLSCGTQVILGFLIKGMAVLKTVGLVLILIGLFLNFVPIGGTRRRVF